MLLSLLLAIVAVYCFLSHPGCSTSSVSVFTLPGFRVSSCENLLFPSPHQPISEYIRIRMNTLLLVPCYLYEPTGVQRRYHHHRVPSINPSILPHLAVASLHHIKAAFFLGIDFVSCRHSAYVALFVAD
jgi:hypothetical protein